MLHFFLVSNEMFGIIQRMNALSGALNSVQIQVGALSDQVSRVSTDRIEAEQQGVSQQLTTLSQSIDDVKKSVGKIQVDVLAKYNDLKKDVDLQRKEAKLLETTLTLKLEQIVNKSVKTRTDIIASELRDFVQKSIADIAGSTENEDEDDVVSEEVVVVGTTQEAVASSSQQPLSTQPVDV